MPNIAFSERDGHQVGVEFGEEADLNLTNGGNA